MLTKDCIDFGKSLVITQGWNKLGETYVQYKHKNADVALYYLLAEPTDVILSKDIELWQSVK